MVTISGSKYLLLDRLGADFNLDQMHIHPTGKFLTMKLPVARAGCLEYFDPTYAGNRRVDYKPMKELCSDSFIETLAGIPVTRLHPEVGIVTSDNFKEADVIGMVHPDVGYTAKEIEGTLHNTGIVRVSLTVFDGDAITDIKEGRVSEFSLGAECYRDFTPGRMDNGVAYDAVQRGLTNNHLAAVPLARAGATTNARDLFFQNIAQDAQDRIVTTSTYFFNQPSSMSTTTAAATTADAQTEALQGELQAALDSIKELKSENQGLKAEIEQTTKLLSVEDARELASQAVTFIGVARELQQEVSLDEFFTSPLDAVKTVYARVSDGAAPKTYAEGVAYLKGKVSHMTAPANDSATPATALLDTVRDGNNAEASANDGKGKGNKGVHPMTSRRAAARKNLLGN